MKPNYISRLVVIIIGITMLITGIRMLVMGVDAYIQPLHHTDWVTSNANITDISGSAIKGIRGRHLSSRTSINYWMTYEYVVDGTHYTGEYGPLANSIEVGRSIRIKYDPNAPENSTGILAPGGNDLALVIIGTILAVPGFFMTGILGLLRRLLRGLHRSEIPDYAPPEEERTAPPKAHIPSARDIVMGIRNILRTLAPILIFLLFGFILMLIQNARF